LIDDIISFVFLGWLSLQLMSNRTSYYTIGEQKSCEELKFDEESLVKYFSITQLMTPISSTEHISSSQKHYNPSKISLNNNYIVFDKEQIEKINLSNSVFKM